MDLDDIDERIEGGRRLRREGLPVEEMMKGGEMKWVNGVSLLVLENDDKKKGDLCDLNSR